LRSPAGFTATSHVYVMEWAAILRDIVIGLVAAGMLAAWVPDSWWRSLFLTHHPAWAHLWGPVVGPLVAVFSFVCSIGNVPLAAVLATGGGAMLRMMEEPPAEGHEHHHGHEHVHAH